MGKNQCWQGPHWMASRACLWPAGHLLHTPGLDDAVNCSDSVTRVNDSTRLESRFLLTRTRLESRWEIWWLDTTRVTFFTKWLDSSHSHWLETRVRVIFTKSLTVWWTNLAEVAGVTFSDSDSAPFPKFWNPDPAIFQIWQSHSCSDSGYNHQTNLNLPIFYLRNAHTDSCYCRNWKVTPDPGPVFPKF